MSISIPDLFAALGNNNHVAHFIKYFEGQIDSRAEVQECLSNAPNYYAWLSITSEYVCYLIRSHLFGLSDLQDSKVFDIPYIQLIDKLNATEGVGDEVKSDAILFVKIRHLIVHKGFPNPHAAAAASSREISTRVKYGSDEVWELCKRLRSPKAYPGLKAAYDRVSGALSVLSKLKPSDESSVSAE